MSAAAFIFYPQHTACGRTTGTCEVKVLQVLLILHSEQLAGVEHAETRAAWMIYGQAVKCLLICCRELSCVAVIRSDCVQPIGAVSMPSLTHADDSVL